MAGRDAPLSGLRVLVTRPRDQAAELVAALERAGAEPVVQPLIRIAAPADPAPLRAAVRRIESYDWIVFTSANGVCRLREEAERAGLGAAPPARPRLACVGPATAAALEAWGRAPDVVPSTYIAESVADAVIDAVRDARAAVTGARRAEPDGAEPDDAEPDSAEPDDAAPDSAEPGDTGPGGAHPLAGARILLPVAEAARPAVVERLAAAGASVERVDAYRTVPDPAGADGVRRALDAGTIDVVTLTSSSAAESFADAVGTAVGRAVVAAIGPITAAAARARGVPVEIVATRHTGDGLLDALIEHHREKA